MAETTQEDAPEQQCSLDDIEDYLDRRLVQVQEQYQRNKEIKTALDSFSTLFEQLYTDEARATAVLLVQQKQDSISKEYIDKAIRTYETQKKFDKLAQLAKNAGIAEHLLATYDHRGNMEQEAVLAKHLGLEDKAITLYKQAILRHLQGGSYDVAGRLAQDAGLEEHAQKLFILGRKKEKQISKKTIEFYEWFLQHDEDISSIVDRIIEVLEYTGRFEQGAEIAEKHGLLQKALENYERAGQWARAGTSAEQALYLEKEFCHNEQYELLFEKAILNYCKAGWIDHAANIALREGKKERAILLYEENQQSNKALALAKEIGLQRTLMFYEKAGWYKDAMEAVKNTDFSSRESLYKALHILSTSSFEVSLPEIPLVPKKKYAEKVKSDFEEEALNNIPHLTLLPPPSPPPHGWVRLPPEDASIYSSSDPSSFPPYRQEDPSGWFLSRVGLNVVSSLTTDAIKKYLPVLLTVIGISGSSYYATHKEETIVTSLSTPIEVYCPAEKQHDLPEGLLTNCDLVKVREYQVCYRKEEKKK